MKIKRLKSPNNIELIYDTKNICDPEIYVENINLPKDLFLVFPGSNVPINITEDFIDFAPNGIINNKFNTDLLYEYISSRKFKFPLCTYNKLKT